MSYHQVEIELKGITYKFEVTDLDASSFLTTLLQEKSTDFTAKLARSKTEEEKVTLLSEVFISQINDPSVRYRVAARIKEMVPDIDPALVRCDLYSDGRIDYALRLDSQDTTLLIARILGLFENEWKEISAKTDLQPKKPAAEDKTESVAAEVVEEEEKPKRRLVKAR